MSRRAPGIAKYVWIASSVLVCVTVLLPGQTASPGVAAELPPGPMLQKATVACLECHGARIILQQRLSKATWTKEVDKMTKWGALVDPADRDALIDYLSTNFSPEKPPFEPPKTAAEAAPSEKKSK
jgi:mono/diheme cytochrome c family protein